jgi:Fanconi-associated nuclease 1
MSSVWDYSEKVARFVEVKGPGDSLSETQKVWIDVLLSAGIQVEVCKVKSKDLSAEQVKKRKRAVSAARGVKDERGKSELEVFGVEEEDEEEGGEFDYESGEEGKGEGRWEKKSKV